MGISEQSTLLCEQKLFTSRQIFRYAVPARTVTKKHCPQVKKSSPTPGFNAEPAVRTKSDTWRLVSVFAIIDRAAIDTRAVVVGTSSVVQLIAVLPRTVVAVCVTLTALAVALCVVHRVPVVTEPAHVKFRRVRHVVLLVCWRRNFTFGSS